VTSTRVSSLAAVATEDLLRLMRACADQCVSVVNMPDSTRLVGGDKGTASPEQAATLSAVSVLLYARELERRGVDTGVGDLL